MINNIIHNNIYISLTVFILGIIIWIIKIIKNRKISKEETITYYDRNGKKITFKKNNIYKQNERIRKEYYKKTDVSHKKLKKYDTTIYSKNKIDPEFINQKPLDFEKAKELKYKGYIQAQWEEMKK